jgi:hypothetical protein
MNTATINTHNLVDGYFSMLNTLKHDDKLELISKLSQSLKADVVGYTNKMEAAFGGFIEELSAEELIAQIRNARTSNTQKESFE